jgi:hypothetical protein
VEFASRYEDSCRNLQSNNLCTFAKDKEGHIVDNCSAPGQKRNEECRKNMRVAANERSLYFTTTSSKTGALGTQHTQQGLDKRQIMTDDRTITVEQLCSKLLKKKNLSTQQQEDLYNILTTSNKATWKMH